MVACPCWPACSCWLARIGHVPILFAKRTSIRLAFTHGRDTIIHRHCPPTLPSSLTHSPPALAPLTLALLTRPARYVLNTARNTAPTHRLKNTIPMFFTVQNEFDPPLYLPSHYNDMVESRPPLVEGFAGAASSTGAPSPPSPASAPSLFNPSAVEKLKSSNTAWSGTPDTGGM